MPSAPLDIAKYAEIEPIKGGVEATLPIDGSPVGRGATEAAAVHALRVLVARQAASDPGFAAEVRRVCQPEA